MKISLLFFLLFLTSVSINAQISNSRWKGTLRLENPLNVILDFRTDTVSVYSVADSSFVESMTYSVNDNILTVHKIDGQSDCDNSITGKYKFEVKDEILFLKLIEDNCNDRSSVLDTSKWFRWKDHPEIKVDASILNQYSGIYELDPQHQLSITLENGRLQAEGLQKINLPKSALYAESDTKFFLKVAGLEMDFVKDENGKVVKLISHEEKDYELKKIK